ncbi:MAG: tetratricopeptide repeat protein [Myxococcota bacterium]|nr:tetratricopeptide repeat protein [Myxococcota bacterium]
MRSLSRALLALVLLAISPAAHASLDDEIDKAVEAIQAWDIRAATSHAAAALKLGPQDPTALAVTGHVRLMQGSYTEAMDFLSQSVLLGGGDQIKGLLALATATAEVTRGYEEHVSSKGHFIIRHEPGVDAVIAPLLDEVLEEAWSELIPLFGYEPQDPVRVEVYPRVEVLAAVSPLTVDEIKASGTIALCKYNRLMITSPRDLVYGYGWADTVAHELIHLLITKKSRNTVPIWLHEGLAKYYETHRRPGAKSKLERRSEHLLARALANKELVTFEEMSPSMAKLPTQEITATAFAEVFTVIAFLEERAGDAIPIKLLEAMAAGKSDREAVAKVSGIPWSRFESSWRRYLRRLGLRTMDDVFDQRLLFRGHDTEADELEALKGETGRKYVWLADRLRLKGRLVAAVKEYKKATEEVGDATPFIQAKLGGVLLELGRAEEAVEELMRPLPLHPDYMLLRLHLGHAHLRLGELQKARRHLEAAIDINPYDPELHGHLSQVYRGLGLDDLAARAARAHALVGRPHHQKSNTTERHTDE